jgi:2'-5' RNA ligase
MPDEQEFIPHVTLMRIKKISNRTLLDERIREYKEKPVGLLHPKIELIQSNLTPQGAQYSVVKTLTA